jgi:hypothetical protein
MKPYGDAYVELIARRLAECYGIELGKAIGKSLSIDEYVNSCWIHHKTSAEVVLQIIKEELDDNKKDYTHTT